MAGAILTVRDQLVGPEGTRHETHAHTICNVLNHQLKIRAVGHLQLFQNLCRDDETKKEWNINIELKIPYHIVSVFLLLVV